MTTTTALEQAAVTLAEHGYHVFPCKPERKEPLTSNGFKAATRDERQILHWWDRTPTANIGIACGSSGIVVLDIDTKHGADPNQILKNKTLDGAAVVQTGLAPPADATHPNSIEGRRGVQVYFRGSLRTGDTTLPGVEIRGEGAYVVAPPSLHPSGVPYGPQLPMPVGTLPEVPEWVTALQRPSLQIAPTINEVVPKGEQHSTLVSLAGTMRRRGMNAAEIEAALLVTNRTRLEDPAPASDIRRIAQSVAKYPAGDGKPPKFKPLAGNAQAAAKVLTDLLELPSVDMKITGARVYGKGSSASLELDVSNNETLTFATLREMMRPQTLIAEVAACTGAAPALKQVQCAHALTLARQIATVVEVDSENDIAREWGQDFLDLSEVIDLDLNNQVERWGAFEQLARREPFSRYEANHAPTAPLVLRHLDGTRYVRTVWFERYVKTRDSSVSRTAIGPRMGRAGWERRGKHGDIKATSPALTATRTYPFWVVKSGWEGLRAAAA